MARRADHTHEEIREMAVLAGCQLIEENGFSNFSARKVAARIGYTVGTLYNVFGSYDGLILHINAKTLDDWYEYMQKAVSESGGDSLRAMAHAYINYCRGNHRRWLALFEHHMGEGADVPEWYLPKMERFFTGVEMLLLPYVNGDREQAELAAKVLWSGIHGICVLYFSGKIGLVGNETPEQLAESLLKNYLKGVR